MTIDISVYCKRKPDWKDLEDTLNWEKREPLPDYDSFTWDIEGYETPVFIDFTKEPQILSFGYDEGIIEDLIIDAKKDGITIPDRLNQMLSKNFALRADKELYDLLCEHPDLIESFPFFKFEFGLTNFSQGNPLYSVNQDTKLCASKGVIKKMVGLASYFANAFDGLAYEDQTEELGDLDPDLIHSVGMSTFLVFVEIAKKAGHKFNPDGF